MKGGADAWTWVLAIFGAGNLANGVWMLVDPAGWYVNLPAAVPDFGPLNEHFVRDIGAAYTMTAVGLLWAAFVPASRAFAIGLVAVFYGLHAVGHVYDTTRGLVGPEHWGIDFVPIYVPAILLVPLWLWFARSPR